MYAIRTPQKQTNGQGVKTPADCCTPNILPCRIHYDGPVDSFQRYWTPVTDEDSSLQTSHFRGRKLRGRRVAVPEGYQGIVAVTTESILPPSQKNNEDRPDDAEDEPEEPVRVLEKQGAFDDFIVWGHETAPAANDPFVKGVEEWVKLAEAMHSSTRPIQEAEKRSA